ncbi:MAG: ATP-binding protein [Acidiferrobacterales bacterium]
MRAWNHLQNQIQTALRYQLVVYILLPVFLAAAVAIGVTIYWFYDFTRDNLFRKVRGDVYLAQYAFQQISRKRYLADLQHLADSFELRTAISTGNTSQLEHLRQAFLRDHGFTFVHITGPLGRWLYEKPFGKNRTSKPTALTARALRNEPTVALEVFNQDDLARENPALKKQLDELAPHFQSNNNPWIPRALMLRAVVPIRDAHGKIFAVLDGGVLLNNRPDILNAVRDQVYGSGSLPPNGQGLVGLLLDDSRIDSSTESGIKPDTFLGTRVPDLIRNTVVGTGKVKVAEDALAGRNYISAYAPIYDVNAQSVGMLQVGFDEGPFRMIYFRAGGLLLIIVILVTAAATVIAFRGVRMVTTPIEKITEVVQANKSGLEARIGPIEAGGEIQELARQFDAMLDLLRQRNAEIRRAASELEQKVEERTRELANKNADLEETVKLLNETQRQLLLKEKLASVGEMAAGIAHEINNPTSVLIGNLDLLVRDLGEAAKPVEEDIDLIVQQVDRIRHIVNSLLQFARPDRALGNVSLTDVNEVVKNAVTLVRHAADGKAVHFDIGTHASNRIRINEYELEQVLINLVLNAIRIVGQRGEISIETWDREEGGVTIDVTDNGPGISEEDARRLFDPFFTTNPHGNSGLGLSISYGIVRRYDGEISVESELGKGSTFHIQIPGLKGNPEFNATTSEGFN